MRLNTEQQKLVEENHNLIYSYAKQHNLDLDEWYGVLALALCYAAYEFDENRSKFSTFYYVVANSRVGCAVRNKKAKKRVPDAMCISIEEEFKDLDLTLADTIEDKQSSVYKKLEIREVFDSLDNLDTSIVLMRLRGVTQKKISSYLGISQSTISRRLIAIKDKLIQ